MAFPFGRWVMIDRFPEEPVIAFVYLDPRAGPSAKGGLASEPALATMPSRDGARAVPRCAAGCGDPEVHVVLSALRRGPATLADRRVGQGG